jgi:hypothetical protein
MQTQLALYGFSLPPPSCQDSGRHAPSPWGTRARPHGSLEIYRSRNGVNTSDRLECPVQAYGRGHGSRRGGEFIKVRSEWCRYHSNAERAISKRAIARLFTSRKETTPILCISLFPFYRAAIPANTPMAPRAKPAKVAWAAAPVEVLEPVAAEAAAEVEPEAAALVEASEVDWFALPALVRAEAVTPVLFWQSALYSAEDS